MPLVIYEGNHDAYEGTGEIRLAPKDGQERVLVTNGSALEITDSEYTSLRGRYKLSVVDEGGSVVESEPVVVETSQDAPPSILHTLDVTPSTPSGSGQSPSTPSTPIPGS